MTHDKLLAKIDTLEAKYTDYPTYLAICAVVELHKPVKYKTVLHVRTGCACGAAKYPCPTIQAIEAAFND